MFKVDKSILLEKQWHWTTVNVFDLWLNYAVRSLVLKKTTRPQLNMFGQVLKLLSSTTKKSIYVATFWPKYCSKRDSHIDRRLKLNLSKYSENMGNILVKWQYLKIFFTSIYWGNTKKYQRYFNKILVFLYHVCKKYFYIYIYIHHK